MPAYGFGRLWKIVIGQGRRFGLRLAGVSDFHQVFAALGLKVICGAAWIGGLGRGSPQRRFHS
jgi:hypothetical protein